ncbi:RAMP superfamily CRISPR-associated protein [Sulfolobus sp. E11-6]|uniref:RAMP superfamily CRISPR-associated protein n=1 Tax=Sulfolobus sp. E11-6 TaxID=2663020 RepID=UPI001296A559|nr:RAMP superfamily CRISPR-associated protein [Sulfolobus sp. E11-6]QGA68926.1 hypothetical protein GFS33_09550 [Sulfolobus sp. E11-6]
MKRVKIVLHPITPYVISAPRSKERKVEFYFGINPERKFIPPSTLKGLLRTAAIYANLDDSCEYQTSLRLCGKDLRLHAGESLTCADLQDLKEEDEGYSLLMDLIQRFKRPCKICRVFGNTKVRGKIRIVLPRELNVELDELQNFYFSYTIGRTDKELKIEASKSDIEFEVICEDDEAYETIEEAVNIINQGIVRIGRFKSRGFGILKAESELLRPCGQSIPTSR